MKYLLLISAVILGISITITSCKKSEEVEVERVGEVQTDVPKQGVLAGAMKKAAIMMRRLSKAVENNNWDKMDMWAHELKEGIGFTCVELYMVENNDIPSEFTILSDKFNSAINKIILCSKEHDTDNANLEFDNLVKSCDACHESFNKDMEGQLEFH
ncbi:MAG: hypothetical protein ACE5GU_04715 [Candidatus Scalinduaceae bacterium]